MNHRKISNIFALISIVSIIYWIKCFYSILCWNSPTQIPTLMIFVGSFLIGFIEHIRATNIEANKPQKNVALKATAMKILKILNGPPSKGARIEGVIIEGEAFLKLPQYESPRNEFALQDATYEIILTLDQGEGVNFNNIWTFIQQRFPTAKIEDLREKIEILKKQIAIDEFQKDKFRYL